MINPGIRVVRTREVCEVLLSGIRFPPNIIHTLSMNTFGYFKAFFGRSSELGRGGFRSIQTLIKCCIGVSSKNDCTLQGGG